MIAEGHHWDEHIKLVNLVTRLCGQAYSFYRSCDGRQWSCYVELVEQLIQCFTLVRIGAVQSSLFHDRQQKEKESIDDYAQELRKKGILQGKSSGHACRKLLAWRYK